MIVVSVKNIKIPLEDVSKSIVTFFRAVYRGDLFDFRSYSWWRNLYR